jgi:hypothetical protein
MLYQFANRANSMPPAEGVTSEGRARQGKKEGSGAA